MTRLQRLFDEQSQSPWLDNLRRGWVTGGELQRLGRPGRAWHHVEPVDLPEGHRGRRPTTTSSSRSLVAGGSDRRPTAYWDLVTTDIRSALVDPAPGATTPRDGVDGFVSVEVAPALARDTDGHARRGPPPPRASIAEPNLYVKIPGTAEGVPAIQQMIAEGRNINVTLIFSARPLRRGHRGLPAGPRGLVATGGDLSPVSSVASFFVSRVDTEVDRRLDAIGTPEALALRGKAAVANAQLAYELFLEQFSRPPLGGARRQGRPGAAPALGVDVDQEPGLPRHALRRRAHRARHRQHHARRHPRRSSRTTARSPAPSTPTSPAPTPCSTRWRAVGVDLDDVGRVLEEEGVASFSKSFDELLGSLQTKADQLQHGN